MSEFKIIAVVCIIALAVAFTAGCIGNGIKQGAADSGMQSPQSTTQTGWPAGGSSGEYAIDDSLPSDIKVDVSAIPVDGDTILIKYTLDLSSMGTAMKHEGWDVILTAYAYNPEEVDSGFSVNSYDDIISGGIPYETRSIRLYPSNVYPDKIEVSVNPQGMAIDTKDYYIYGIVMREA